MKKKNLITAAVSLALVAVVGVGATLAYFTDKTDTMTNVFVSGKVDVTLIDEFNKTETPKGEYEFDENGVQTGILYTNVMPGDTLDKDVSLMVRDGSSNAHVGIVVTVDHSQNPSADEVYKLVDEAVQRQEAVVGDMWQNVQDVNVFGGENIVAGKLYVYNPQYEGADWTQGVPAGTLLQLFSDIQVPTSWDNAYADTEFCINVQGYAIQADNMAASLLKSAIEGTLRDDNGDTVLFEQYGD